MVIAAILAIEMLLVSLALGVDLTYTSVLVVFVFSVFMLFVRRVERMLLD